VTYRVRLSDKAERDIEGVLRWFAANDADAASTKWLRGLFSKIDSLKNMPNRCGYAAEAPELEMALRELFFGRRSKYRVLFLIEDRDVNGVHIRRASRDRISMGDLN
jgi:plasmid stabilization system protein ParE